MPKPIEMLMATAIAIESCLATMTHPDGFMAYP
jgi:hypothetical protein